MDEDIIRLKRKRKIRNIIIIVLIVLIVGGATYYFIDANKKNSKIIYETEKLEKGKITAIVSSTGSLSAVTTVDVGSQVSGKIQKIYVDFNDRVVKGQVLARIDPATFEAQHQQAMARLNSGQAQLSQTRAELDNSRINIHNAQAGIHQAQAGISTARANLQNARGAHLSSAANKDRAKAELDNKKAEYKRASELYRRELISLSEKENSEMQYRMSLASYESAKAQVESAKANVNAAISNVKSANSTLESAITRKDSAKVSVRTAEARVRSAEASIAQARGDVEQVQINLDRCVIRSPINGIVIDKKVDEGQTVAASFQTPVLFNLARDLKKMEVKAAVDEADIGKVKKGQYVYFTVDAFPEENFPASVYQVRTSPNVNQNVVTYDVIVRTDNKELKLKPGMTANIYITVEVKEDILRVPNAALRFRPDRVPNFPYPEDVKKEMAAKAEGKDKKKKKEEGGDKAREKKESSKGKKGKLLKGQKPKSKKDKVKMETSIWVLKNEKPERVKIATGISDTSFTEMKKGSLKVGMEVITEAITLGEKIKKEKKRRKGSVRIRAR